MTIEKISWMLAGDPLARHPRAPAHAPDEVLAVFQVTPPVWELERQYAGTLAVPLLRGARLDAIETLAGETLSLSKLSLFVPMGVPQGPSPEGARKALDWLSTPDWNSTLGVVERQVLSAWLDGPAIPTDHVASLLGGLAFDRLTATPVGRLVVARGKNQLDSESAAKGREDLELATRLALVEVSADTPGQQAAWRTIKAENLAAIGVTAGDPVNLLLSRADERLGLDAGVDRSTGLAVVAQAALRLRNGCPDIPCGGMDRMLFLQQARRWSPEVGVLVNAWEVIAWKDAIDHLEVSYERASAVSALDGVAELLAGPDLDIRILVVPGVGPTATLALTRALGLDGMTDKDSLFSALRAQLQRLSQGEASREPMFADEIRRIVKVWGP